MLMTPGPTEVPERVRKAMSREIHNPDLDVDFFEFYHDLEYKLKKVYQTKKDMLILGGEGILGLEAAVASCVEEDDRVLCISNGIFGDGFADFVKMYGGEPEMVKSPYNQGIDIEEVKSALESNNFKAATMVHCETPTGTLNDFNEILKLLKEEDILTIVDAVSSLGGTYVPVKNMDICIGGSQKCFSSPPGLTTMSISDDAWGIIENKEHNSFYTNLKLWKDMWMKDEVFPYTHLVSNIYALDESMDMILEEGLENVFQRHEESAKLCRTRIKDLGLSLYPDREELCSPTVTAIHTEEMALKIQKKMKEDHDILIATSLGDLENQIIRIGHMGYNADKEKVNKTLDALEEVIKELNEK